MDAAPDPLAELLAAPANAKQGPRCSLAIVVELLTPQHADTLAHLMEQARRSSKDISDALARLGHTLSVSQLDHHRRGQCSCRLRPDGWTRGRRAA